MSGNSEFTDRALNWDFEVTDRYQAAGIPYPDPNTVCLGDCEGMGCYPVYGDPEMGGYDWFQWEKAHKQAHTLRTRVKMAWQFKSPRILWERCDGCHFVKCPDCDGTGKRKAS